MSELKSSGEPSAAVRRVGAALQKFGHSMEATKNFAAKQLGLHPSDLSCLGFILSAGEPVSPKQITAYLDITSGTGTALLDRLETAGYIKRVPNPADRRSVLIVLDEAKAAAPLSFYQVLRTNYARVMGGYSDQELTQFVEMLDAFSSIGIEEQIKAGDP
jgi:DNA-binding MarR family transcriptional regulator